MQRASTVGNQAKCVNKSLAKPNNVRKDGNPPFMYRNSIEFIWFLIQQPLSWEHMTNAPAKEFKAGAEHFYIEVKSNNLWWWNEQV